jgi:membrane protease YdiL (CAAX protease family)
VNEEFGAPPAPENEAPPPGDGIAEHPAEVAPLPLHIAPARDPFWGYSELLIFLGVAPAALLLGALLVRLVFALFNLHPAAQVVELLPAQLLGYIFMFGALAAIFRIWYDRPFWPSLGWRPMRLPFTAIVFAGVATGFLVAFGSSLIHVKDEPNPLTDLMRGRTALILMTVFGVTAAPVAEELAFRGFLQPLLVRSLGPALGILLTAVPFGLLHFQEYGNSWRHAVMICLAGAAFGVMRQATGSTRAAALMHASYNALFFTAAFSTGKDLHR